MAPATKSSTREQDWGAYAAVPPPPTAPEHRPPEGPSADQSDPEPAVEAPPPGPRSAGHDFDAELDATELDDRDRPTTTWTARGRKLSRAGLIFRSRRMCYGGRRVLVAVHLIDSEPVPLFGLVRTCDYDGDGMYLVTLDFLPVPDKAELKDWIRERAQ